VIRVGADTTSVRAARSPGNSSSVCLFDRSTALNDFDSARAESIETPESIDVIMEAEAFEMAHP